MNIADKVFIIIVAICLVVAGFFFGRPEGSQFGALRTLDGAYGSGTSMATTSVGVSSTSTLILSANADRMWAAICNDGSGIVGILEEASTAGRSWRLGYPIASTTAFDHCYIIDRSHPYWGAVSGVADTTSTVRYLEK
jgi:hypothetical protein